MATKKTNQKNNLGKKITRLGDLPAEIKQAIRNEKSNGLGDVRRLGVLMRLGKVRLLETANNFKLSIK